jgi:hypothetical protein
MPQAKLLNNPHWAKRLLFVSLNKKMNTMRKNYNQPEVSVTCLATQSIICASAPDPDAGFTIGGGADPNDAF